MTRPSREPPATLTDALPGLVNAPHPSRRRLGLAALASVTLLVATGQWMSSAAAQTGVPRLDPSPPPPEGDRRSRRALPEPRENPRSDEPRRGGAAPGGGTENEDAPDEPAPHGCPVNDRKLELIV